MRFNPNKLNNKVNLFFNYNSAISYQITVVFVANIVLTFKMNEIISTQIH
jgi:hypothetical protein